MAEGDKTSGGDSGGAERDILAERRARREQGEAALASHAQEAEAAVHTLEAHVSDLRGRLREVEEEQRRTAEQLAEREHEIRRVKQREYAEQQLRVEAEEQRERLEREQRTEVDRLQRRLTAGDRHARELTDRLESMRRELAEAEQAASAELVGARRAERELSERESDLRRRELALERIRAEIEQRLGEARSAEREARAAQARDEQQLQALTARLATLETHAAERQREMDLQREAREQTERELQSMREGHTRMEQIVRELQGIALQLRNRLEPGPPIAADAPTGAGRSAREEEDHRLEMARALAAAVERLRARVTAVDELEEARSGVHSQLEPAAPSEAKPSVQPQPERHMPEVQPKPEEAQPTPERHMPEAQPKPEAQPTPERQPSPEAQRTLFTPRVLALGAERQAWLAPAIRRVAERHDAKLAAELVCELLAAQGSLLERSLTYTLRIEGLEDVQVQIDGGRATVRRLSADGGAGGRDRGAFLLEGAAADFAELAAGGARRRLPGVRVRGSRRRLRRLLAARRLPLELSDLAEADIRIWPGLLLLALSEAIPPEWTVGHSFVLAFVIESPPTSPSATIYVQARDGAQIAVTRVRGEQPLSTVQLGERAFLCMLAGAPLPAAEQVLVDGPEGPLRLLLGWSDRIQGEASGLAR